VRRLNLLRAAAAAALGTEGTIALAAIALWWQLLTAQADVRPSAMLSIAAVALAGAIVTLLAQTARPASALQSGPLLQRAVALRRKSWSAVFQRQLNPDAAGHVRPRAPSAAPAAA
jgi:hypothetical protein